MMFFWLLFNVSELGQLDHGTQFDLLKDFLQAWIAKTIVLTTYGFQKLIQFFLWKRSDQQAVAQLVETLQNILATLNRAPALFACITDFLNREQGADRADRPAAAGAAHAAFIAEFTAESRRRRLSGSLLSSDRCRP